MSLLGTTSSEHYEPRGQATEAASQEGILQQPLLGKAAVAGFFPAVVSGLSPHCWSSLVCFCLGPCYDVPLPSPQEVGGELGPGGEPWILPPEGQLETPPHPLAPPPSPSGKGGPGPEISPLRAPSFL